MKEKVVAIFASLLFCGLAVFIFWENQAGQIKIEVDQKNIEEDIDEIALQAVEWMEETSENVTILLPENTEVEKRAGKFKTKAAGLKKELLACKDDKARLVASEKIRKLGEDFEAFMRECQKEYMNKYERGIREVKDRTAFSI